jgi:hypothetical protein
MFLLAWRRHRFAAFVSLRMHRHLVPMLPRSDNVPLT